MVSSTEQITTVSDVIHKPLDIVRRQAMDIAHHIKCNVHPNIRFVLHSQTQQETRCRLEQRILWITMRDEYVSSIMEDGAVMGKVLSGSNAGMYTIVSFTAQGTAL